MIRSQGRPASIAKFSTYVATVCLGAASQAVPAGTPAALSFHITTRAAYHDPSDSAPVPEQIVEAGVQTRGRNLRVESTIGGRNVIMLYTPPYLFRMYPESQTGVRYPANAFKLPGLADDLNIETLISNPAALRSLLVAQGAVRVQTTRQNGVTVDIYKASKFMGRPQQVTAWFRHSDSLPIRLVLESRRLSIVSSWGGYQRKDLPAGLFSVPPGYRIRPVDSE